MAVGNFHFDLGMPVDSRKWNLALFKRTVVGILDKLSLMSLQVNRQRLSTYELQNQVKGPNLLGTNGGAPGCTVDRFRYSSMTTHAVGLYICDE